MPVKSGSAGNSGPLRKHGIMGKVKKFTKFLTPTRRKVLSMESYPIWVKNNQAIPELTGNPDKKPIHRNSTSSLDLLTTEVGGLPKPKISKQFSVDSNKDEDLNDSCMILCVDFKNNINEDSLNFFRDFPHLYNFENPKIIMEINSSHMEYVEDFISYHLEIKNEIQINKNEDSIEEDTMNIFSYF